MEIQNLQMNSRNVLRTSLMSLMLGLGAVSVWAAPPTVQEVLAFTGNLPAGGNGSLPSKPLVEGADGWLYSAVRSGAGTGMVDDPAGGTGGAFFRFREGDGYQALIRVASPNASWLDYLTYGGDGRLYANGTGMSDGAGLYSYDPSTAGGTWTLVRGISNAADQVRADFGWLLGSDGRLYNHNNNQRLYAVTKDGAALTIIHQAAVNNERPRILLSHSNGKLYGATALARGVIFLINPDGQGYQEIRVFPAVDNGADGGPFFASNAMGFAESGTWVYGYSQFGGVNGTGMLFRISAQPDSGGVHAYESIYQFKPAAENTEGVVPLAFIAANDGHLYGITEGGGINNAGVIFRWNTTLDRYETLYAFDTLTGPPQNYYADLNPPYGPVGSNLGSNLTGMNPTQLMQTRDGRFYGTTQLGGSYGWGTVFRFNPGDEVPVFNFVPKLGLSALVNNAGTVATTHTVAVGASITLSWRGQKVSNCLASTTDPGSQTAWAGARLVASAGETLVPNTVGSWTYSLTCQSSDPVNHPDPVIERVTLNVVSRDAEKVTLNEGGGGGGLAWLLVPLALLGLSSRQRKTCADRL